MTWRGSLARLLLISYIQILINLRSYATIFNILSIAALDLGVYALIMSNMIGSKYEGIIVPGITIFSVITSSFAVARNIAFSRILPTGFLKYMLSYPMPRIYIAVGGIICSAFQSLIFIPIVSAIYIALYDRKIEIILLSIPALITSIVFSSLFIAIGLHINNIISYNRIMVYIVPALSIISTLYYPIEVIAKAFPEWVVMIAAYNPLSLSAEIARSMAGLLSHTMIYDYSIYHIYALESLAILSSSIAIASKRLRTIY